MLDDLRVNFLHPVSRWASPFDLSVAGYAHTRWWEYVDWALGRLGVSFLVIANSDEEVARALVLERRIETQHALFEASRPTIEIDMFEVRRHLWGSGVGRGCVDLIRETYAAHQTVAFSLDADGFWESIGFSRKHRLDDEVGHSPLYVASPLLGRSSRPAE
ncbi:hypothetical protein [Microbacterium sp.]|uniref:hypothetical protein n=1 Tax=Microbacterium sp. TaxID=51671 RepID=UPI00391A6454